MTEGETSSQQQINADAPLVFILQKKLSKTDVCSERNDTSSQSGCKESSSVSNDASMTLPLRDLKTGQIWRFKYKFWPRDPGSYLLAKTEHFVDKHKLEAGDMIKLYKGLPDNQFVIEAVKQGKASCGPAVPPATIARRGGARRIGSIRKSPNNEVLPPGFI